MRGLLVYNGFLINDKFNELNELFFHAAKELDIALRGVKNSELLLEMGASGFVRPALLAEEKPDFAVFWDKDILLAEYLESRGIPVYNSSRCIALCDDKRRTHMALARAGLPMPETLIAPMTYAGVGFTDFSFVGEIEKKLRYPMVVKEAFGSFGAQVYRVGGRDELLNLVRRSPAELIFQQYIESSAGRDVRLQVVGERVTAAMYRHSETDFRANVSAGGSMEPYEPSGRECELALAAARAVGADFAGVDLLLGDEGEGSLVCEVNSNAHFKNLMDCTGADTARDILLYIKHAWERGRTG